MSKIGLRARTSALVFVFLFGGPASAQVPQDVATSVVIDSIQSSLTSMINKARNDGDYLLARAGVEAKNAMDAWVKANGELLDKTFAELDVASRENFARAAQLVANANAGVGDRLETVLQITESANQLIASIPLGGYQTYILRFIPRIQPPQMAQSFPLRIRGTNLHKGDPKLRLNQGFALRDLTGPLEAQFTIPASELPRDQKLLTTRSFKIEYTTPSDIWWRRLLGYRDSVEREIPVVALPIEMAVFNGVVTRTFQRREEQQFTRDLGQFKAKNSRVYRVATPPDGWRWDMGRPFSPIQGNGEAGRCEGIDPGASSENGVSFYAQLDKIQNFQYPGGTDGYVNCSLQGTIYRSVAASEDVAIPPSTLTWVGDAEVLIPTDAAAITLRVKTFDGRERIFTGTGNDMFFDVRREPGRLVISPKVPDDLIR